MSSELITLAERYVLERLIAQGGMAAVWSARDDVLARTVAVKILHPHLAGDATFLERFRREALAAARLHHPNIVAIYDTGEEEAPEGPRHYIVMEYCGGGTLADVAASDGGLAPERAVSIGSTVCDALGYAHDNGIVHRDIKPANALITEDGTIKVGDFGIAKAAEMTHDVTTTGTILGTVSYLSPEQARGEEPDARSDIYSVGAMLYELLVGRPPFSGPTHIATAMKHVREPPPPPRSIRAGIPKAVEAAVMKALEKDPDRRFQSAPELKAALLTSSSGAATTAVIERARTAGVPPAARARVKGAGRGALRWLAPALLLIAISVGTAVLISAMSDDDGTGEAPTARSAVTKIEVINADDLDPIDSGGDGEEHSDDADLAHDGDPSTFWSTETYYEPLPDKKPGVGLVFDLGEEKEVTRVRVTSPKPGYSFELRAGSENGLDEEAFDLIETVPEAKGVETLSVETAAQYWLVWIKNLPGGLAGAAEIAEVEFFGP